jgi:hypothetical protein
MEALPLKTTRAPAAAIAWGFADAGNWTAQLVSCLRSAACCLVAGRPWLLGRR